MPLSSGTRLGPYEIVAPLGAGGMGEVYRARDPRLSRDVAVKVLPGELAADPDRLRRFRLEARAASALNHPNVLTVFDADVADGTVYLVTELLEGETLRQQLARGALPIRNAVAVAAAVARGLSAVHAAGIVHRDLKPENVFVTRDEQVRILDFGLARPAVAGSGPGQAPTLPGLVVGTPGYLSPEQVEGGSVDARSDVFGLGCVLYEMLTGQRAFDRPTAAEAMTAALRDEPGEPLLPGGRPLPAPLALVLTRCLEKSPQRRFQSASDLAFQLETLGSLAESAATVVTPRPASARPARRAAGALLLALAAAAAGAGGALLFAGRGAPPSPRTTHLTFSGTDTEPDASPDGSLVVFTSARERLPQVWVKQVSTGEEAALTSGPDRFPRLSADGATVLFGRLSDPGPGAPPGTRGSALHLVGVLGGEPRKVVDAAEAGDLAPDGKRLVFTRVRQGGDSLQWLLLVAALDGGSERSLGGASALPLVAPRFSPDGRRVAVVRSGRLASQPDELLVVDVETGSARTLPRAAEGVLSAPAWTGDGTSLVYAQSATVTAYVPQSRLVAQDVESGAVRTLAWMANQVTSVDVLADGSLVLDGLFLRQGLREVPLADPAAARWLTRGSAVDRQPVYTPDGKWVVFSSTRSGNLDLWSLSPGSGAVRRLTYDPGDDWDPWLGGDGKTLLWSSNRTGHFEVWAAEADGRRARLLSADGADAENPTADPSGRVVTYVSGHPQRRGLWRMGADGASVTQLVSGVLTMSPEVSPDGKTVLYHTPPDPGWCELRAVSLADGAPVPFRVRIDVPGIPLSLSTRPRAVGRARWMPDGKAVAFVGLAGRDRAALFVQDFEPGKDTDATRRPLVPLAPDEAVESFGISPDGTRVTVSVVEQSPCLMVVDGLPGVRRPWAAPAR